MDINELRNPDFWKDYHQNVQAQIGRINGLLKDLWVASESPSFQFLDRVLLHEVVAATIEMLKPNLAAKKRARDPRDGEIFRLPEPHSGR